MRKIIISVIALFVITLSACAGSPQGKIDGNYDPKAEVTRSEFINKILSVIISTDVVNVKGGLFDNDVPITRGEAAYIIYTALHQDDDTSGGGFSDVSSGSYIYTVTDIIGGYPDNTFKPDDKLINSEYEVIIKNIMDKAKNENKINIETERKFLIDVNNIPYDLSTAAKYEITQTYINFSPEVRVRKIKNYGCSFAVKLPKDTVGLSRQEIEFMISDSEYESLFQKKEVDSIQKTRYQFWVDDHLVAIDIYEGALKGLAVAEIEFESEELANKFTPLYWFIKDVTADKRYKNAGLAKDGMPQD